MAFTVQKCRVAALNKSTRTNARGTTRAVRCAAAKPEQRFQMQHLLAAGATAAALNLLTAQMAFAGGFRLPPIDNDPNRCERGYVGNTIGQANAVSDKLLDLRQCSYKGADLSGRVLAGALLSDADLSGTNMREAVMTKAYGVNANFEGADLTNAVIDRVDLSNTNLKNTKFVNAVVTGTIFAGADLTGSNWEDSLVGGEDVKRLCENPTLVGESRLQVGCRQDRK